MAASYCMYCGARFESGHRFCMGCGRPLDAQLAEMASAESSKPAVSLDDAKTSATSEVGSSSIPLVMLEQIYGEDDVIDELEDLATTVYEDEAEARSRSDEDDVPTLVLEEAPAVSLRRKVTGSTYKLTLPATLGRGSTCNPRITGNRHIGREHARIGEQEDGYVIVDLASTNRTFVNGKELIGQTHMPIVDGDVIRLADEEFEFIVG